MSIAKYKAFIAVAELGGITKAARALGYSQPSISHMIDSLEKEVGFPLLVRDKDQFRTTDNGELLLYHCRQIVNSQVKLQETVTAINGLLTGSIRIGSLNSLNCVFLPEVIAEFKKLHPEVQVYVMEQNCNEMTSQLQQGMIDIAFAPESYIKNMRFYPLFRDDFYLILPEEHPLAKYDPVPLHMMRNREFIKQMDGWDDVFRVVFQNQDIPVRASCYIGTGNDITALELAAKGLGFYILPGIQLQYLPEGLAARQMESRPYRTLGYAVKSQAYITPAMSEFIRITKEKAARNE